MVIFRSKNVISHPIFYGDLVYKLRRVKDTPNFISSCSKIVLLLRRRQYNPLIIERTKGLVLDPSTALSDLFFKHCTLTNKAMGTIWRTLSKPSQRRQGSDIPPLWLLVGAPSATDLSSLSDGRSIACPIWMTLYIFLIDNIYYVCCTCIDFYVLSALGGCWFVVYIMWFIYKFSNLCPFDYIFHFIKNLESFLFFALSRTLNEDVYIDEIC